MDSGTSRVNHAARVLGTPTRDAHRRSPASSAYLSAYPVALLINAWVSAGFDAQLPKRFENALPEISAFFLPPDDARPAASSLWRDSSPGAVTVASGSTAASYRPEWVLFPVGATPASGTHIAVPHLRETSPGHRRRCERINAPEAIHVVRQNRNQTVRTFKHVLIH